MQWRVVGGAAAAVLAGLWVGPVLAQNGSPPGETVVAQAETPSGDAGTTRRTRKKAAKKSGKAPSSGQMAARERQKKCSAEWKTAKDASTVEAGMKWPQFWSQCNKRLKGEQA